MIPSVSLNERVRIYVIGGFERENLRAKKLRERLCFPQARAHGDEIIRGFELRGLCAMRLRRVNGLGQFDGKARLHGA